MMYFLFRGLYMKTFVRKRGLSGESFNFFYFIYCSADRQWSTSWFIKNLHDRLFSSVFDATWLNTQYYKVRIKSKVEQSRDRSSALPHISVL